MRHSGQHPCGEVIAQRPQPRGFCIAFGDRQLCSHGKGNRARDILCAGTQTALLTAAMHERCHDCLTRDDECADTCRPTNLVR